jgi:hypothetical protein
LASTSATVSLFDVIGVEGGGAASMAESLGAGHAGRVEIVTRSGIAG